ncbi:unnamed protein product [Lactuca saligna]|uniref:Uncharacterized protein n=1 Tax=Lactuca saligna TaxID=75948 RepID=A0AA35YI00_LACSI|nr:unnamed protein product [Lactuca saligna]
MFGPKSLSPVSFIWHRLACRGIPLNRMSLAHASPVPLSSVDSSAHIMIFGVLVDWPLQASSRQNTSFFSPSLCLRQVHHSDKIAHIKDQPVQAATNIALQPNSSYSAASSGVRYETSLFLGSSGNGSRIRKGSNKINHLWHDLLIGLNSGDANVGKKLVGAHHYNKDGTLNYRRE